MAKLLQIMLHSRFFCFVFFNCYFIADTHIVHIYIAIYSLVLRFFANVRSQERDKWAGQTVKSETLLPTFWTETFLHNNILFQTGRAQDYSGTGRGGICVYSIAA